MSFAKIAQLHHDLNRMRGIDRDTFFGRLEILEWTCEETHAAINEPWRKLGRYGNIVIPAAFEQALEKMKAEYGFTEEEMLELMRWVKGQSTPDQAVAGVMLQYFIQKNY
jgi:hypothetical protein